MENLTKTYMNDELAKQISQWDYEGEYAIYNLPSYKEMKEKNMEWLIQKEQMIIFVI